MRQEVKSTIIFVVYGEVFIIHFLGRLGVEFPRRAEVVCYLFYCWGCWLLEAVVEKNKNNCFCLHDIDYGWRHESTIVIS